MSTLKFIRTTHINGRHRPLSPDAQQFWQGIGGVIGSLLRPETPMTLPEIVTTYAEYLEEYPETTPNTIDVPRITWYLFQLVELDLAAIIVDRSPPNKPTLLPHPAILQISTSLAIH